MVTILGDDEEFEITLEIIKNNNIVIAK